MAAADWLDLLHHYIGERTPAEKQEALDRQLTGPLDTWTEPDKPKPLRPPAWAKFSQADIDRMNQYRNS